MAEQEHTHKDHAPAKDQQLKTDVQGMDPAALPVVTGRLIQRFRSDPSSLTPKEIQQIQRMVGNHAVVQARREAASHEIAGQAAGQDPGETVIQRELIRQRAPAYFIQRDPVDDSYQEAVTTFESAARNRRLYDQAIQQFEAVRQMAITENRRDIQGRSLYYLGSSQAAKRRWQAAIFAFELSLDLLADDDPLRAQAQQGLEQARGRAGIPTESPPAAGGEAEAGEAEEGEAPTEVTPATQARFDQALESFNQRHYAQAARGFQTVLRQRQLPDEMRARATYYLGASHCETRQWNPAREQLERARSEASLADDLKGKCLFYLGMCDLRQEQYPSAILYLEQFLETPGIDEEMAAQARRSMRLASGCTSPEEYCDSEYATSFQGRRNGPGYIYEGVSAGAITVPEAARPDIAAAFQVFQRLLPMEGQLGAVNTYDGMVFTWGAGFAGARAQGIYRNLGEETRAFLQANAPYRFTASGILIDESIRLDRHALGLVSYVGENEPYKSDVLRTQFRDFLVHTYHYNQRGQAPAVANASQNIVVLAAHMNHWLPEFFPFPGDLNQAVADGGAGASDTLLAAIILKRFTHKMLHSSGFGRVDDHGRYRIKLTARGAIKVHPIRNYTNNLNNIWGRGQIDVRDARIQGYIPCFTSSSAPYFQSGALATMPDGNLVLEMPDHTTCFDFGAPLGG